MPAEHSTLKKTTTQVPPENGDRQCHYNQLVGLNIYVPDGLHWIDASQIA